MCYIHSAALVAEYLRSRDKYPGGSYLFKSISPNIVPDEGSTKDDGGDSGDQIYTIVSRKNELEISREICSIFSGDQIYTLVSLKKLN